MIAWIGPEEVPRGRRSPSRWMSPGLAAAPTISSKTPERLLPGAPLASPRSRYFSVTISRIGPTFWAMPPWTRTRLSSSRRRASGGHAVRAEDGVPGQQSAAADAELRVAVGGERPLDQLDPRPDAAGVLPAAAGAAEPLAEDRPRRHQPPLGFGQRPGQRLGLPRRPHAHGDQAGEQVGRDGQPRPLRDVVDAADELEPQPRADHAPRAGPAGRCRAPSSPGGTSPDAITAAFSRPR